MENNALPGILSLPGERVAALFLDVKKRLWGDIMSGRFVTRLPPEPDLAEMYGVSRMTLRRSLAALVSEGFLDARPGQGTFIRRERRTDSGTRTIGLLIVPYLVEAVADPYFGLIFTALAARLGAAGYLMTYAPSPEFLVPSAPTEGDRTLRRPVDGVVAAAFDQYTSWSIAGIQAPMVLLQGVPLPGRSNVLTDDRQGITAVVQHLVELGHRRIAHIHGSLSSINGQERLVSWRAALTQRGLPIDESLLANGSFTWEGGLAGIEQLWRDPAKRPTAVFCANDCTAFGVYRWAAANGVRIPQDLSIVGFDDIETSRHLMPPLTTVRVPYAKLAEMVCDTLIAEIAELPGEHVPQTLRAPTELVVRASTAAPRGS